MDSDNPDQTMAPDEMYLMLQADMTSIKRQEEVLQSEIDDIAAKFHSLLESCGLTAEPAPGTMAPPSTPSFMKTASLTHVTNIEDFGTPSFLMIPAPRTSISESSDDETMDLIPAPFCSLAESEVTSSDGGLHDMSSKTLIMDNNSNYINSPAHSEMTDNTPIIEALPDLDVSPSSTSTSSSTSTGSSANMASSDGYPKSDDSSDNQIVPECYDLDKEFMSRLQYYSDFTIDRQKKINSMVSHLTNSSSVNNNSAFTEELFTRHVEGAETPISPVKINNNKLQSSSKSGTGSDYKSTPSSRHRSHRDRHHRKSRSCRKSMSNPIASSTMLDDSFSSSSSGRVSSRGSTHLIPQASSTIISTSPSSSSSGKRNRTNGSNPRACSTLLDESFLSSGSAGSHGSRHRSTSIPMASSTMIFDTTAVVPGELSSVRRSSKASIIDSDDDCESIYTWSIHDSDVGSDRDVNLEKSYMRNVTHSVKKKAMSGKPPLPPVKRTRSNSISSKDSGSSEKLCHDQNLHKLLGETCLKHLETISVIECNSTCRDGTMFVESMFEDNDDCAVPKSNTLPRSSTKIKLVQDKSSGSSSMEAKRASLPDLSTVCSTVDDFHSVPESLESISDEDDISALPERLQCAGKSSSSKDSNDMSVLDVSTATRSPGGDLIDSILTDSPNSVCSSGINAPSNSPATNCSSSSKVSCSTTSDARSSDSNINAKAPSVPFLRRNGNIPYSPKVQNIDVQQPTENNNMFKVPKQTQPLRNLFRFRRNKSKTPDRPNIQTSTPKSTAVSVVSDPNSKRELFPTPSATNQHETRLMDKKAVIKKFKRFSDNFHKRDKSGRGKIETLANL